MTSAPQETSLNAHDVVSERADDADALVDFALAQAETGNIQVLLVEVNAASKRLDDGAYGKCAVCGRAI
jgi:RNA polymerase-binding transcription factor DksA